MPSGERGAKQHPYKPLPPCCVAQTNTAEARPRSPGAGALLTVHSWGQSGGLGSCRQSPTTDGRSVSLLVLGPLVPVGWLIVVPADGVVRVTALPAMARCSSDLGQPSRMNIRSRVYPQSHTRTPRDDRSGVAILLAASSSRPAEGHCRGRLAVRVSVVGQRPVHISASQNVLSVVTTNELASSAVRVQLGAAGLVEEVRYWSLCLPSGMNHRSFG